MENVHRLADGVGVEYKVLKCILEKYPGGSLVRVDLNI